MFGRSGKIRKAVERSTRAALAGQGDDSFAPIEKLRDSEKVDAYVDVCEALIFDEAFEQADQAVDRALALAPRELYVLHAKAEVASESGRAEDALAIYRQMHELAPDDPQVVAGLASLLLANHDVRAAVALLEPYRDGDNPLLQLRLGEALFAADRNEEALAVLERVHDHYVNALKRASFVDNPREIQAHLGEARRLRDDVVAELHGREAAAETLENAAAPAEEGHD